MFSKIKEWFKGPLVSFLSGVIIGVFVVVLLTSCQGLVNTNGSDNQVVISDSFKRSV